MKSKKIMSGLMTCATLLTIAAPIIGSANTNSASLPPTQTSAAPTLKDTPGDFQLTSPWKAGDTSISGLNMGEKANKVRWTLYDTSGNIIANGLTDLKYNNGTYEKWTIDLTPYAGKSIQKINLELTYGAPESTLGHYGTFYMQQNDTNPDDIPGDFQLTSPWKAGDTNISGLNMGEKANKVRWTLYDTSGNIIANGLTDLKYNNGTYEKWTIDLTPYAGKLIQKINLELTYGAPESTLGHYGTFYVR